MTVFRVHPGHQHLDKRDQNGAKTVKVSQNCFFLLDLFGYLVDSFDSSLFLVLFVCLITSSVFLEQLNAILFFS